MEPDDIVAGPEEADFEDETQDFRFLKDLTRKGAVSIPKRGEKDFEPDGTNLQSNVLEESREAMIQALSVVPVHSEKNRTTATWISARRLAAVTEQHGVHFKSMGRADRFGKLWLLPEEVIYMVERGSLECFYEEGLPMSIQGVYAACLEATGGLEKYQVYANLRRSGYAVFRAPERQHDDLFRPVNYEYKAPGGTTQRTTNTTSSRSVLQLGIFNYLFSTIFSFDKSNHLEPLIPRKRYSSSEEIYDRLLIPPKNNIVTPPTAPDPHFHISFHIWKPKSSFKKSNPGPPDFQVAVVSTKDTSLPSLTQIENIFFDLPTTDMSSRPLYQALKDGERNFILAVVDFGVISFQKFSDSHFGKHRLEAVPPPPKGKGKGKGKGVAKPADDGLKRVAT